MTFKNQKDDELSKWIIVGAVFTGLLIFVDFGYSSFDEMPVVVRWGLYIAHGALSFLWIVSLANWKDPNFDYIRQAIVVICVVLGSGIAFHHSQVNENKQVIIDSQHEKEKK